MASGNVLIWLTVGAIGLLLFLILYCRLHAFLALILTSIALGLASGMEPVKVLKSIQVGFGEALGFIAVIVALGSIIGRFLEHSGGGTVLADGLLQRFGRKYAAWAVLAASFLVGLPIFFEVGFIILAPIAWSLARESKKSLLYYGLPMAAALTVTHAMVPPHPAPAIAAQYLKADLARVILMGIAVSIPMAISGGIVYSFWISGRIFVPVPAHAAPETRATTNPPTMRSVLLLVTLPVLLIFASTIADMATARPKPAKETTATTRPTTQPATLPTTIPTTLPSVAQLGTDVVGIHDAPATQPAAVVMTDRPTLPTTRPSTQPTTQPNARPGVAHSIGVSERLRQFIPFIGHPFAALTVTVLVAIYVFGFARGLDRKKVSKLATEALSPIGALLVIMGAGGAFKQIIVDCGVGSYAGDRLAAAHISPLLLAYLIAAALRVAQGSATVAITTAAGIVAPLVAHIPGYSPEMIVLALCCGGTILSHVNDAGFWLVAETFGMTVPQTLKSWTAMKVITSLVGFGVVLLMQATGLHF